MKRHQKKLPGPEEVKKNIMKGNGEKRKRRQIMQSRDR
jgi:hypothetical protein